MTNTILPLGRVHVGDVRTKFKLTVLDQLDENTQSPVNLASVATMNMIFLKPDKTKYTFSAAVFSPPGTDGTIYYLNTDPTFINQTGLWRRAAQLNYLDGSVFYSSSAEFECIDIGTE